MAQCSRTYVASQLWILGLVYITVFSSCARGLVDGEIPIGGRSSPQAEAAWANGKVWCGGHDADECADCPRGNGAIWCNGDCKWVNGMCIAEGQHMGVRYTDCGAHRAASCGECPAGQGEAWCNGDCAWQGSECSDRPEGDPLDELIFQLTRIKKYLDPVATKTMRKPEVQHFSVGQRVRIRDYGITGEPMSEWKTGTVTSTTPLRVQRDGWSGSQAWDEVLPLDIATDPNRLGVPENWEVAYNGVRVRAEKSLSAEELSVKYAGDRFRGHLEGNWVELSDEPGFMMVRQDGIHLVQLLRQVSTGNSKMKEASNDDNAERKSLKFDNDSPANLAARRRTSDDDARDTMNSDTSEDLAAASSVAAAVAAFRKRGDFEAARAQVLQHLRDEGDRDRLLDLLFRMWRTSTPESSLAERLIWEVWIWHPMQEARAMMQEVLRLFEDESSWPKLLFVLEALVTLDPKFVEAWNKRATLHFMMGRYEESLADISQVLRLEPRHFGALSGRQLVLQRQRREQEDSGQMPVSKL